MFNVFDVLSNCLGYISSFNQLSPSKLLMKFTRSWLSLACQEVRPEAEFRRNSMKIDRNGDEQYLPATEASVFTLLLSEINVEFLNEEGYDMRREWLNIYFSTRN
jgi:hypothetical protein